MRSAADSKADLERFLKRVADADAVWSLRDERGVATCASNEFEDEDGEACTVLLFFSDRAYAARVQAAQFPDHVPEAIDLFDFLFRWLPGMSQDGVLAGPNWSAELTGCEVDPFELRGLIEAKMRPEHVERHEARYKAMTASD